MVAIVIAVIPMVLVTEVVLVATIIIRVVIVVELVVGSCNIKEAWALGRAQRD